MAVPVQILFVVLLAVIIIFYMLQSRKNRLLKEAQNLEQRGHYLDAVDIYARINPRTAAKLIIEAPEATQILMMRRLEAQIPQAQVKKIVGQIAEDYRKKKDIQHASTAYLLIDKVWTAAQVLVEAGVDYVPRAVHLIDQNPHKIPSRDEAIRNLAQYAYNQRLFMESAELLKTIGADEEARTVLIAAAAYLKSHGRPDQAEIYSRAAGRSEDAAEIFLDMAKTALKDGDFEKTRRTISSAAALIRNLTPLEQQRSKVRGEILRLEQILKMLDSARDLLRKNDLGHAQIVYSELIDSLGDMTPSSIYAEAALSYESTEPQVAEEYYRDAAQKAKTLTARQSFLQRAQDASRLITATQSEVAVVSTSTTTPLPAEVTEDCCVCRMRIKPDDDFVRCEHCGSPAHRAHLGEWLKIRGTCPVCRQRTAIKSKFTH